MMLEGDREPVGGRPGQSGRRDQPCQGGRPGLQRTEDQGGFVENADPARVVHVLILPSRMLERKSCDSPPGEQRRVRGARAARAISRRESAVSMGRTLSEKVWDDHVVQATEGDPDLLYIDLHLI